MDLNKKWIAEFLGTAALLLVVVGSGIMGEQLSHGNLAIALLANSLATGAGLFVLIQCLSPISGAHLNPAVSLVEAFSRRLSRTELWIYWIAQVFGAVLGVAIANFMFERPVFQISEHSRAGIHLIVSELVATFGLVCTIRYSGKSTTTTAAAVAAYIVSAYWFTSSTSFANPAVTAARILTNTFTGIAPASVLPFVAAQVVGAALAHLISRKK